MKVRQFFWSMLGVCTFMMGIIALIGGPFELFLICMGMTWVFGSLAVMNKEGS